MASVAGLRSFALNSKFLTLRSTNAVLCRHKKGQTSFPDYYLKPVYRKELQAALVESGEIEKLKHVPVCPPAPYQTCSVYHDDLVNKVTNHIMEMGKKTLARSLVEKTFENIKRIQIQRYHTAKTDEEKAKIELDPKKILYRAVENAKPLLQMFPVKRGGIVYQVPGPIKDKRSLFLSIEWLLEAANDKDRTLHFPETFARELLDGANNTGRAVKKKQELHKQCEANRAYAHYRWQ